MTMQPQQANGQRAITAEAAPTIDELVESATRAYQQEQAKGKDARGLSTEQRATMLAELHRALGLNPLSGAVLFLTLQGKEILYVTRQGTDQIAARLRLNRETVAGPEVRVIGKREVAFCQVRVTDPATGRTEMSTATLAFGDPVNDLMKVETKAKRRATLSIAGLGLLNEEEVETIPGVNLAELNRTRAGWEHDGHEVTKPVPGARGPSALDRLRASLAGLSPAHGVAEALEAYHRCSQGLSDEGESSEGFNALRDHLRAALPITGPDTQGLLNARNTVGIVATCRLLDALAALNVNGSGPVPPGYIVAWWRERAAESPELFAGNDGAVTVLKRVTARLWAQCMGVAEGQETRAFGEALKAATQTAPEAPANDGPQAHTEAIVPSHLEGFYQRVAEIELPGEAVSVWMQHRAGLAPLPADDRDAAWRALCRRTEEVGKMKNAKVWLKKAIAEEDARRGTNHPTDGAQTSSRPEPRDPSDDGPRGGGSPRPQAPEATDARGSQHAVAPAEGMVDAITTSDGEVLSTVADVVAYLGTVESLPHYEAWCRKHGAHRLAVQCADVVADRLITLDAAANADGSTIDRRAARERVAAWAKAGPKQRAQGRAVQQRRAA